MRLMICPIMHYELQFGTEQISRLRQVFRHVLSTVLKISKKVFDNRQDGWIYLRCTYHKKDAVNVVWSCEDSHTGDLWAARKGIEALLTHFRFLDAARSVKVTWTWVSLPAIRTKQTLNSILENLVNHLGFFSSISEMALLHTSCSSAITDD